MGLAIIKVSQISNQSGEYVNDKTADEWQYLESKSDVGL
jgi:hypothetical protein